MEAIKAQYKVLAELKRIDEKVFRLQNEIEKIPEQKSKLEQVLVKRREEYDNLKAGLESAEKELRKSEGELKEKEDKLTKAQDKMMDVKTNEEYQAAIRENEGQKGEKGHIEERIIKALAVVDEHRKKFQEADSIFQDFKKTVEEDLTRLEEDRLKVVAALEQQLQERSSHATQLAPDISAIYRRISSKMRGVAVVAVEHGMCSGCHMRIRPQLYNEVIGFKTIHRCPNCGRILVLAQPSGDTPEFAASES